MTEMIICAPMRIEARAVILAWRLTGVRGL